jgi:putative DNA primase/helicase
MTRMLQRHDTLRTALGGEPYRPEPQDLSPRMAETAELTDDGNAAAFAAQHGLDVRYVAAWKTWLVWTGDRWAVDDLMSVQERAKKTGRKFFERAGRDDSRRDALIKHAKHTLSQAGLRAMLGLACSVPTLAVAVDELDRNDWSLNVRNGTIDLRTGVLREHRREDYITKLAPVDYDAKAECPMWEAFVSRVFGDDVELIGYLQRAVGYALTGSVSEQCLFFLHGAGKNGKSTFVGVLLELLGDYAIAAAPNLLMAKQSEAHPTEQADLHGKRFVVCQETEQGKKWAETSVKQLTGGDMIRARRMRQDFFQFTPTHKFFVTGNHKPGIAGTDEGIWRRLKLVPFEVTIAESERDPFLADKLRAERAGILRWAVEGCLQWQRNPLTNSQPVSVSGAVERYRQEQDLFGDFLSECCVLEPGARVSRRELNRIYTEWCSENGVMALGPKTVAERLRERGCGEVKSMREPGRSTPGKGWTGVRKRMLSDPECSDVVTCSPQNTHPTQNAISRSVEGQTEDYKSLRPVDPVGNGVKWPPNVAPQIGREDALLLQPAKTEAKSTAEVAGHSLEGDIIDPWAPWNGGSNV